MTTSKEYCDVICDAIDTYGREAQTDMCIEECSELIKALLKFRRLHWRAACCKGHEGPRKYPRGDRRCANHALANGIALWAWVHGT